MLAWLSWLCLGVAAAGCIYAIGATLVVRGFARRALSPAPRPPSITVVKPLRGAEPGLYEALISFCRQDYVGPVQVLFGAARPDDPCVPVVRRLMADLPGCDLELIIDPQVHGANGKVSTLINLARRIRHEVVVVSDSDICVAPD